MPAKKASDYIRLSELAPIVYELTGVTRKPGTMYKWHMDGRVNAHGVIVKLKATKRFGNLYSTKDWLEDFIMEVG